MGLAVRSSPGIWLLDFEVGGRTYRYATERCSVTDQAGTAYVYDEGLGDLEVGLTRTLGERRIGIEVNSPEDWALIEARGVGLDQRRAILRYWRSGLLDRADVVATGLTAGIEVSDGGEALTFEIVDDPESRGLTLPPASAMVTEETWPVRATFEVPPDSIGMLYPVVIGYPGDHPKRGAAVDIGEPSHRAPRIEYKTGLGSSERYIVAHGRIQGVQATLWEYGNGDPVPTDLAVATTTDLLGQTVSYVQVVRVASTEVPEFWVGLRNASGWGGGILSPYTGALLRGAGEVARYILDYFAPTVTLDRGRMRGAQSWLDRFQVDGVILGENVVTWLNTKVLAHLPVIGVDGPRGFYLAPMRWDAVAADAVAHLDADSGRVDLDGTIGTWDEPVYNSFQIDYRPRRMGEEFAARRTLTSLDGDLRDAITTGANLPPFTTTLPWVATTENDYRVWGSVLCRSSQARYGVRPMDPVQHLTCWDDATAAQILHYLAAKYALPKRVARYVGGAELDGLLPGDVVTITDTANYLSAAVALVVERTVSAADVALDVVLLDAGRRVT